MTRFNPEEYFAGDPYFAAEPAHVRGWLAHLPYLAMTTDVLAVGAGELRRMSYAEVRRFDCEFTRDGEPDPDRRPVFFRAEDELFAEYAEFGPAVDRVHAAIVLASGEPYPPPRISAWFHHRTYSGAGRVGRVGRALVDGRSSWQPLPAEILRTVPRVHAFLAAAAPAMRDRALETVVAVSSTGHVDTDPRDELVIVCGAAELLVVPSAIAHPALRFRERGAALLAEDDAEYAELRRGLKRIYEVRSRIVHGRTVAADEQLIELTDYAARVVTMMAITLLRRSASNDWAGHEELLHELDDSDRHPAHRAHAAAVATDLGWS
jgi:hypothetical protein